MTEREKEGIIQRIFSEGYEKGWERSEIERKLITEIKDTFAVYIHYNILVYTNAFMEVLIGDKNEL